MFAGPKQVPIEKRLAQDEVHLQTLLSNDQFLKTIYEELFKTDLRISEFCYDYQWFARRSPIHYSPLNNGQTRGTWLVTQGEDTFRDNPYRYVIKITDKTAADYNTLFHELINYITAVILDNPVLPPILLADSRIASCGSYYPGAHWEECPTKLLEDAPYYLFTDYRSTAELEESCAWAIINEAVTTWEKLDKRFIVDPHQGQFKISQLVGATLVDRGYFRQENATVRLSLEPTANFLAPRIVTSEGDVLKTKKDFKRYFSEQSGIPQITFPELITRLLDELDQEKWVSDLDQGKRLESARKFNRMGVLKGVFISKSEDFQSRRGYIMEYLTWAKNSNNRADPELVQLFKNLVTV